MSMSRDTSQEPKSTERVLTNHITTILSQTEGHLPRSLILDRPSENEPTGRRHHLIYLFVLFIRRGRCNQKPFPLWRPLRTLRGESRVRETRGYLLDDDRSRQSMALPRSLLRADVQEWHRNNKRDSFWPWCKCKGNWVPTETVRHDGRRITVRCGFQSIDSLISSGGWGKNLGYPVIGVWLVPPPDPWGVTLCVWPRSNYSTVIIVR